MFYEIQQKIPPIRDTHKSNSTIKELINFLIINPNSSNRSSVIKGTLSCTHTYLI